MKNLQDNAIKCAIALFAAAGMVACSSSDDVVEAPVNPTYDGTSVKTQFAINIGSLGNKSTRMAANETQQDGNTFLGMESIGLLPLSTTPAATTAFTSNIVLGNISSGLTGFDDNTHLKVYNDVSVPVGTTDFLLYAKGPSSNTGDDAFKKGSITMPTITTAQNPSDIEFKANKIVGTSTAFSTELNKRATFLNSIKNATGWSALTAEQDADLAKAYEQFTSTAQVRAVAGSPLTKWMQSLYDVAVSKKDVTGGVGDVAQAIMAAIVNTNATTAGYFTADATNKLTMATGDNFAGFPGGYYLPDGVAIVTCSSTGFAAASNIGSAPSFVNVASLIYPLPITYRCNTNAKATDADITLWPSTTANWVSEAWTGWDDAVKSSSRTIALDNPVNYGVALLETMVKCATNTLKDNSTTETYVNVPSGGFPVKGLLVGGQPESVDWNYLSETSATTHTQTVYDKAIDASIKADVSATTYSASNYTLLFDSYTSDDEQAKIRVAIELENNSGQEFTAQDGIVAKGEKFYLIAELDPNATGLTAVDWTNVGDDLRFPKKSKDRVFIQDFRTIAKFNITSLEHAYVSIPDLRSTTLKLGLSVNLEWQSGLTFEISID